jgi:hypothetical protein
MRRSAQTRIPPAFWSGQFQTWAAAHTRLRRPFFSTLAMVKLKTAGVSYANRPKVCLEAVRQWPGCETVRGIQIIRNNRRTGFTVRITLYGETDRSIADRAMIYVEREKRRRFHLLN